MAARGTDRSAEFPILAAKTYLANHSLGAVPASAEDALREYWREWSTLGIQAWEGPWWKAVVDFQRLMEKVLGAPKDSVATLPNATRAMAAVASCLDFTGPRRRVVMTDLEFTTFYPFWRGQERYGAELVIVESKDGITVPPEKIAKAVDDRTALVTTCHVYFRSGAIQDVAAVAAAAHRKGALCLIDGYQAGGTVPIDVEALESDFYVGGCHKFLCGGPGAGYLYVRPELMKTLTPRMTGWFGLANPFGYVKDLKGAGLNQGIMKFFDGTPNVPGVYAAREGVKAVLDEGITTIRKRSVKRTADIIARADEARLAVHTPREDAERGGMVCLEFPGSKEATAALVAGDVVVDWRPECGLRVSPHFYNADRDVDRFFDALAVARKGKRTLRAASLK